MKRMRLAFSAIAVFAIGISEAHANSGIECHQNTAYNPNGGTVAYASGMVQNVQATGLAVECPYTYSSSPGPGSIFSITFYKAPGDQSWCNLVGNYVDSNGAEQRYTAPVNLSANTGWQTTTTSNLYYYAATQYYLQCVLSPGAAIMTYH